VTQAPCGGPAQHAQGIGMIARNSTTCFFLNFQQRAWRTNYNRGYNHLVKQKQ